jgi:hypothetical protein
MDYGAGHGANSADRRGDARLTQEPGFARTMSMQSGIGVRAVKKKERTLLSKCGYADLSVFK